MDQQGKFAAKLGIQNIFAFKNEFELEGNPALSSSWRAIAAKWNN